jgi:hypothetical protein
LYVVLAPSLKLKRRVPLDNVTSIEVSHLKDGVLIVRREGLPDGDVLIVDPSGQLVVCR